MLSFHNAVSKVSLLYGSECWTLGKAEGRCNEASQMRFVRPVVGVARRHRVENKSIRRQLVEGITIHEIWRYCQKWKEHASKLTSRTKEGLAVEMWKDQRYSLLRNGEHTAKTL